MSTEPVLIFSDDDRSITGKLAEIAMQYIRENEINKDDFTWITAFNDIPHDFWAEHGIRIMQRSDAIEADSWDFENLYESDSIDDYLDAAIENI